MGTAYISPQYPVYWILLYVAHIHISSLFYFIKIDFFNPFLRRPFSNWINTTFVLVFFLYSVTDWMVPLPFIGNILYKI